MELAVRAVQAFRKPAKALAPCFSTMLMHTKSTVRRMMQQGAENDKPVVSHIVKLDLWFPVPRSKRICDAS
jgi:hypothetical protein